MSFLASIASQIEAGDIPQTRDTVSDCLIGLAQAAIGAYLEGNTPIGAELEHLVRALQNPADPTVRGLNPAVRMMMRMQLERLVDLKEKLHAQAPQQ